MADQPKPEPDNTDPDPILIPVVIYAKPASVGTEAQSSG